MIPDVGQEIEAEAAVGLRDGDPEEPEVSHLLDDQVGKPVVPLELADHRLNLFRHEPPDGLDDLASYLGIGRRDGGLLARHEREPYTNLR